MAVEITKIFSENFIQIIERKGKYLQFIFKADERGLWGKPGPCKSTLLRKEKGSAGYRKMFGSPS